MCQTEDSSNHLFASTLETLSVGSLANKYGNLKDASGVPGYIFPAKKKVRVFYRHFKHPGWNNTVVHVRIRMRLDALAGG